MGDWNFWGGEKDGVDCLDYLYFWGLGKSTSYNNWLFAQKLWSTPNHHLMILEINFNSI